MKINIKKLTLMVAGKHYSKGLLQCQRFVVEQLHSFAVVVVVVVEQVPGLQGLAVGVGLMLVKMG